MTNILLIAPPWDPVDIMAFQGVRPRKSKVEINNDAYSLGLSYIASNLRKYGHEVTLLPLWDETGDWVRNLESNTINIIHPKIIGISLLTSNRGNAFRLIERIHKNSPGIQIVVGGIHVTMMYQQILEKYPYVIAVLGEGEETFVELAEELNNPFPQLEQVRGIAFWLEGRVIKTPPRPLIDLDTLPFPDHSPWMEDTEREVATILTSRGCPNNPPCSFCCLNPDALGKVRFRSPENVVDELEYIAKTYPHIKRIGVNDDTFLLNNPRAIRICRLIREHGLNFKYFCQARVKPITAELVKELELTGFTRINLGVESIDPKVLDSCNKKITPEDVTKAWQTICENSTNIIPYAYLIVGLKGETKESITKTGKFIQTLQRMRYERYPSHGINIAAVFPRTQLFEDMKATGNITDEYWLTYAPPPKLYG